MKTGKQTRVSSSGKTIEIKIPTSWGALTDRQLCYLASLTAMELLNADEVKTLFLTRMLTPKVRYKLGDAAALAELLPELDWMDTPPEEPIRPHALRGIEAVDAHLSGVPFSHYLQIENYYQGYLQTQEPEALEALMPLLYPGWDGKRMHETEHVLVLWWLVGLKTAYTQLFPALFSRTAPTGNNQPDMRELMLAEIRALTGGDVTKNEAVLHADTMDALAELNAKAREAREMNEHLNKK